jgi:hypothetical protein
MKYPTGNMLVVVLAKDTSILPFLVRVEAEIKAYLGSSGSRLLATAHSFLCVLNHKNSEVDDAAPPVPLYNRLHDSNPL